MSLEQTYALGGSGRIDVMSAPQSLAATGNSSAITTDGKPGDALVILNVGAGTGTLAAKLQESDDGTTWTDVPNGGFANNTGTPGVQQLSIIPDQRKEQIRIAYTVTTGPFLISATMVSLPAE